MRIDHKLALALTCTTLAALLVIAAIFRQQASVDLQRLSLEHLRSTASLQAQTIDRFVLQRVQHSYELEAHSSQFPHAEALDASTWTLDAELASDSSRINLHIDLDSAKRLAAGSLELSELSSLLAQRGGLGASESRFIIMPGQDRSKILLAVDGLRAWHGDGGYKQLIDSAPAGGRAYEMPDQQVLVYAAPLKYMPWVVVSQLDLEDAMAAIAWQNASVLLAFWIVILIALAVAAYLAWQITHPMVRLADVAQKIADGDYTQREVESGSDEFRQLARAVNRMADRLLAANVELERKVEEKTESLRLANQTLSQLNESLQRISHEDKLTGLANRRAFDERLEHEWRRAARDARPLCLIMMDIDCFKQFNDALGHQAGDDCLTQIGRILAGAVGRSSDFVARYGGEEFVVLMPGTYSSQGMQVANRICESLKRAAITHPRSHVSEFVTISGGVGAVTPGTGLSLRQFVNEVDEALYAAKAAGRNRFMRTSEVKAS